MPNPAISNLRLMQKNVKSQHEAFNGNVEVTLIPTEDKSLKFYANVKVYTGDVGTPSYTFTPATNTGAVKLFSNADDVIAWLNGAYNDIVNVKMEVVDLGALAKAYVPPTDPIADATKQKARFEKLVTATNDYLVAAQATVTADEGLGWDEVTAHPALQAKYAEHVAQKNTIQAAKDYFTARVAFYASIINPI